MAVLDTVLTWGVNRTYVEGKYGFNGEGGKAARGGADKEWRWRIRRTGGEEVQSEWSKQVKEWSEHPED